MKITIHQPEHMPWLGFFHKVSRADVYVILDNVQFRKNYFQNRNKARAADGWTWFTVPVSRTLDTLIRDVDIVKEARWKDKWWNTISLSYIRSPYFEKYADHIKKVFYGEHDKISGLNIALLRCLSVLLKIDTKFVYASEVNAGGAGSDLILDICRKLGADSYLSGVSGKDYLKLDDFKKENVKIEFQEFHHPIYKQVYEPFIPCMSAIDLLFNHGEKSLDMINGTGVSVMNEVFV